MGALTYHRLPVPIPSYTKEWRERDEREYEARTLAWLERLDKLRAEREASNADG